MKWLRSKADIGMPEVQSVTECAELLKRHFVILFKHSPSCPVSWMAHREVTRFLAGHPDAPVYLISVRQHRDASQLVAQSTGVQHESPQVLVLRKGKVIGSASHDDISAEWLQQLTSSEQIRVEAS
jgi:bacillithiol system protein YtxJ